MVLITLWIVELTSSWWQRMHSLMFIDAAVAMVYVKFFWFAVSYILLVTIGGVVLQNEVEF